MEERSRWTLLRSGLGLLVLRTVAREGLILDARLDLGGLAGAAHQQLDAGRIALLGEVVGADEGLARAALLADDAAVDRTRERIDTVVLALQLVGQLGAVRVAERRGDIDLREAEGGRDGLMGELLLGIRVRETVASTLSRLELESHDVSLSKGYYR
jgi:hypothetical protein